MNKEDTKHSHSLEERVEELTDELSDLCEENNTGYMCLCISSRIPTLEAFNMGVLQGKQFLADLNTSTKRDGTKAYMDINKIQSSTAFALGLLRAFTGSSVHVAEDLEALYAADCLGEA